jgi:hypothetical protein
VLEAFASRKPDWEPGSRYEYHAESAIGCWRRSSSAVWDGLCDFSVSVLDPMGLGELFVGLPPQPTPRRRYPVRRRDALPGGWGW